MKNHKVIDGHLLQNNKKYSHLKLKQKNRIAEWMYQETKEYYEKQYVFPDEEHLDDVVRRFTIELSRRKSGFHMKRCGIITKRSVRIWTAGCGGS